MVSKDRLLERLPPSKDEWALVVPKQSTSDIRELLLSWHGECRSHYDTIYHFFDTGNVVDTSRQIFDFLKQNVPYTKETDKYQTAKIPAAILAEGATVDCKNYALFIGGILDAIKRHTGGDWDWCYRFASYDKDDPEPGHVFVVVKVEGKELWVDPVFTFFNGGDMHEWELDQKPESKTIAGLYTISGPSGVATVIPGAGTVIVDARDAAKNFLVAVNLNLFELRDLLNSDTGILYGPVRAICLNYGVNFDTLLNLLKNG